MDGNSTTVLNNDDCLSGARDIFVTQTENNLSLFAINADEELAILTTSFEELTKARAAPIMPSGTVTLFLAMITAPDGHARHSLICNDSSGNLALPLQGLDTGI